MEITKPILHPGTLKYDIGNITYSNTFLEKLAKSKNVNVELNQHDGNNISSISKLEFKNDALYATMDIPKEHIAEDIAFSATVIPTKYNKLGINSFEPIDGHLDAVVYVNDGSIVRDTKTITKLNNMDIEGEGENSMAEDKELAQKYGALKTKYEDILQKVDDLSTKVDTLSDENENLKETITQKESELSDVNKNLKTYLDVEETKKADLIKSLAESEDDPLIKAYEKMDLTELEAFKDKKQPPSGDTPPRGVGANVSEQNGGEEGSQGEKPAYNYQKAKKELNLR